MHYRVSIYNYFSARFADYGWQFIVRANELQKKNTIPCRFDFKEMPFSFSVYKNEIKQIKPNVVIVFLHLKNLIIWPLVHWLKFSGIPVVFWTKGANLDTSDDRLSMFCYRYLHFLFDGLILYSPNEIKFINSKHRKKIFIANNTVNFNDFPLINETKAQIKKSLNIPFEKVVLFVGRMGVNGERKKVDHLIEVFRTVTREDAGLVIVGFGMSDKIKARINAKNTIYLGEIQDSRQEKISRIFKMADIFCIPGHVGLGINQAFFWGLPIVTEAGGQPPEVAYLKNGRNGFLVPENDLAQLREKVFYLLDNDNVRGRFSSHAKADIRSEGSIENMFDGIYRCVTALARISDDENDKTDFRS